MTKKQKPKSVLAWAIFAEGKIKPWSCGDVSYEVWDCHGPVWEDSKLIRVRIVPVTKKRTKR